MLALALILAAAAGAGEPRDFDKFWRQTRKELEEVPIAAELKPDPAHTDAEAACFKADWSSLGGARVHARYCRPQGAGPFPAVLISPWYGLGAIPVPDGLARRGVAALWYQARGFEVDRSSYPLENSWYVLEGIDSPRTYVFRGIVAHGLRGLDFLASRPEIDAKRLAVMGASQGGGLSLLLTALDKRVSLAAADFPFLSDWEGSIADAAGAYGELRGLIERDPPKRAAVLRTLGYFDALHAASRVRVRALVQAGLKDRTCPAAGIKKVYERLGSKEKLLREYPDADHGDQNAERWKAMEDFVAAGLGAR